MATASGGVQTTTTMPPAYQLPYLQEGLGLARGLFAEGGPQQYAGNTVVPFSPQTENALSAITQRATAGSPVTQAAGNFITSSLGTTPQSSFGAALNPYATAVNAGSAQNPYATAANPFGGASNPYLDATFQRAADKSYQTVTSQFARSGRNVGAAMPVQSDILTSLAAQIYAPAYENERNRQLQFESQRTGIGAQSFENQQARALQAGLAGQQIGAQGWENAQNRQLQDLTSQRQVQAGVLPYASAVAEQDYRDLAALQGVGQTIEGKSGEIIGDNVARWNYDQQRPGAALDDYLRRVSGNIGSTSTTQLPDVYRNQGAGAMGGALAGYQMGGWPGALLGGVFGYYGDGG